MRTVIANAIGEAANRFGYTIWALAICSNHGHAVVRSHRDHAEVIWQRFADASRDALRAAGLVPKDHPVWSHRPYKVFLHDVDAVNGRRCTPPKMERSGVDGRQTICGRIAQTRSADRGPWTSS